MLVELIYTSAPETLDGIGYGVVSKTEGLPRDLEKFLRQLNRYDYELSAGGDQGHEGPVVFSHTTSQETSEPWHVLSRVGFGGFDYTQRAVFLAHHVAIRSRDLGSVRIADLLRAPSLFVERWNGPIGHRPARSIPAAARPDRGRDLWKSVAGHPDWAKHWIELWSQQNGQACFLITPPGTDVVGLFAGASSLLDADQANRIDLVSHMDTDRAGVRFDWIGLSAGGKFARSIQNRFGDRTMDLARPLGGSPPPIAPKPPKVAPKPPVPRVPERPRPAAEPQAADEYWLEPPTVSRGSKRSQTRQAADPAPPPPPPPDQMPGTWTRPLMVAGGLVLGLALIGSGWWIGKSSRPEPTAIVANKSDGEPGRDPSPDPDPTPPTTSNPTPPPPTTTIPPPDLPKPGSSAGNPFDGPKPITPAKAIETRPPRKLRPDGKWPLRELAKPGEVKIAELPVNNDSGLELIVPDGVGIKVEKPADKTGRNVLVVVGDQGSDQKERIEFELVPGEPRSRPEPAPTPGGSVGSEPRPSSAALKARYILMGADPDGTKSLIQALNFCVLRVTPSPNLRLDVIQPIDVYFAPELPAIRVQGSWDLVEGPLRDGAVLFFAAIQEATQRVTNPLKPDFRLDPVSLSVLRSDGEGWPLVPIPGAPPWSLGEPFKAEFELTLRGQTEAPRWPFTLTLTTNFDFNQLSTRNPLIGSEIAPKTKPGGPADPKKEADGSAVPKTEQVGSTHEKPAPPPRNQERPRLQSKEKSKSPEPAVKPVLPQQDDGALLFDLLQRFGRVSGSIMIPLKAKPAGPTAGPDEFIEILRFDKGSSAPTK